MKSIDTAGALDGTLGREERRSLVARRQSLPVEAIAALCGAKKTVALAESCTGGLCAALFTEAPGACAAFVSSAVVYQTQAKSDLCGLDPDFVARFGPVSAEVSEALAKAVRERSGADLGIAITGWAGPSGGTADDPVGTVYLAIADSAESRVFRRHIEGDRGEVRLCAALLALNLALEWARRGGNAMSSRENQPST